MTTLLETRETGAGERRGASAEKPADLYPACKKLRKALGAWEAASAEIEEYQLKAVRAQGDMDTLGDSSLSEEESLRAISDAHGRKELYSSRIASMEKKSAVLLQEVRSALLPAWNEVRALIIRESERRVNILECRVTEVAGGFNEHSIRARGLLAGLVHQSKLVWAIDRMLPAQLIGLSSMASEAVIAEGQSVLGNLEQIIPELGREI